MPRGNGTGPIGDGPRTGRGAGFCTGFDQAGFLNDGPGRGMGRGGLGRGLGFGSRQGRRGMRRRNRFFAGLDSTFFGGDASASEIELLKQQAENLLSASEEIKARIAALESAATSKKA